MTYAIVELVQLEVMTKKGVLVKKALSVEEENRHQKLKPKPKTIT